MTRCQVGIPLDPGTTSSGHPGATRWLIVVGGLGGAGARVSSDHDWRWRRRLVCSILESAEDDSAAVGPRPLDPCDSEVGSAC